MNAKTILNQHRALDDRIKSAEKEIADLREKATAIGSFDYSKDRVKTSATMGARYERLVEKLIDTENQIAQMMEEWAAQREEVARLIDTVNTDTPDGVNQQKVLRLFYVNHLPIGEIAEEMGYCDANIYVLRSKGLNQIQEHLNKFES